MHHYEVRATALFEQDLTDAHGYYLEQAGPISAEHFLDEYDLTVERLGVIPSAATKIGETNHLWCPIGSFVAVFSIDEKERTVYLLRLFYMTSNWKQRILKEKYDK